MSRACKIWISRLRSFVISGARVRLCKNSLHNVPFWTAWPLTHRCNGISPAFQYLRTCNVIQTSNYCLIILVRAFVWSVPEFRATKLDGLRCIARYSFLRWYSLVCAYDRSECLSLHVCMTVHKILNLMQIWFCKTSRNLVFRPHLWYCSPRAEQSNWFKIFARLPFFCPPISQLEIGRLHLLILIFTKHFNTAVLLGLGRLFRIMLQHLTSSSFCLSNQFCIVSDKRRCKCRMLHKVSITHKRQTKKRKHTRVFKTSSSWSSSLLSADCSLDETCCAGE